MQRHDLLQLFLQRWQAARTRGHALSAEEVCAGCPELLDEFRRRIKARSSAAERPRRL